MGGRQELSVGHTKDTTWQEIQSLPGIVHRPHSIQVHPLLAIQLDIGEAAVIQTALDHRHDIVILDDLKARREYEHDSRYDICFIDNGSRFVDQSGKIFRSMDGEIVETLKDRPAITRKGAPHGA